MVAHQLTLFEADRYHDPRVAADRARARALAKLRPVTGCRPHATVHDLDERRASRGLRDAHDVASAA